MTAERILAGSCRAVFLGVLFALCSASVCLLWNSLFGSNHSPWAAAAVGGATGALAPISSWLLDRLPTVSERRSKHKQRLRELQAERERLARGETQTD
jgi:hypothetical protein